MSNALTSIDGTTYISRYDPLNRTTLQAFRGEADSAASGGPFPELMSTNELVGSYFSFISAGALGADSLAVAIQSSDYLFIGRFASGPFDSIYVPPVNRRGALPDLLKQVVPSRPDIGEKALYMPSYPLTVHALSSPGYVAIVYSDNEMRSGRMTGQLYVTIVDTDRRRVCPDAPVAVPVDPLPYAAFRGDVLAVATQYEDSARRSRTVVRRFQIDPKSCEWIEEER